MPLPFILGGIAVVAAAAGVGSGVHGAVKMKEAKDTMESAERRHKSNQAKFDHCSKSTNTTMDELGKFEMDILESFKEFSDTIEKIQNRPDFGEYKKDGILLPKYDKEELNRVSIGAGILSGGLGGAAAGTAGGFAAAGAATSAVMALGTASTGTAIASLSGAAATNATLAALGGGAIAAGGGGIALGTAVLGGATLGIGLLVGGIIFNATGSKLSDKADEAWDQMLKAEKNINKICSYLNELKEIAENYTTSLQEVNKVYRRYFGQVYTCVNEFRVTDWNDFSQDEKIATENSVLLVGLLYNMCKVNLVIKAEKGEEMNTINKAEVNKNITDAEKVLDSLDLAS